MDVSRPAGFTDAAAVVSGAFVAATAEGLGELVDVELLHPATTEPARATAIDTLYIFFALLFM
ncbi:hypothetical protein D3C84_936800 [compost metagenome]